MSSKVKRDIPPIRGLSEKDYDELLMKFPSFEKRVVRFSGRYRTIEKMIEKRIERIKQNQDEIRELTEELDKKQSFKKNLIKFFNPNLWLRKPKKSYPYWRGRVYWSMGRNVKPKVIEFHILSEKQRKDMKLDEEGVKELGVRTFREKIYRGDYRKLMSG